jgi:methyl-accepting chemotaxis protein
MVYITKKDDRTFRQYYDTHWGHVDDVSNAFGVTNHGLFYLQMEGWCKCIDVIIPDEWWCKWAQDFLISVVRTLYDLRADSAYYSGVDMGMPIVAKVNDAITWARNQINAAVTDMRDRIDTEIIYPLRIKIENQIMPQLKRAQSSLDTFKTDIDKAISDVNTMKSNISSFDSSIKAFDGKLGSFDSKLKGLDSTANGLQSQLKDAQAKLNEYKSLIDDLTKRVQNLEGKQKEGFDFLKNLGV